MQDVRMALQLAEESERLHELRWVTRRGQIRKFALPQGWLNVLEAYRLPEPDISWMENPLRREQMLGWLITDISTIESDKI